MTVKMILAVDRDNAIGYEDGTLAFQIKEDLQRFKTLTMGGTLIMGFKTWASLNRPQGLPGRRHIVLTNKTFEEAAPYFGVPPGKVNQWRKQGMLESQTCWFALPQNVGVVRTFQDTVEAHQKCLGCEPGDLWIIGGAEVYCQAIAHKLVDEIHLTRYLGTATDAPIRVPFDLFHYEDFIDSQYEHGVQWTLDAYQKGTRNEGAIMDSHDFVTLKKLK